MVLCRCALFVQSKEWRGVYHPASGFSKALFEAMESIQECNWWVAVLVGMVSRKYHFLEETWAPNSSWVSTDRQSAAWSDYYWMKRVLANRVVSGYRPKLEI